MGRLNQKRRKVSLGAELLEGRELLNSHMPALHEMSAHVQALAIHATKLTPTHSITGTVSGISAYTNLSITPIYLGTDAYSLSGTTSAGTVNITASDTDVSVKLNSSTYTDHYHGGVMDLTLANGSTIAVNYKGSGRSSATTGPFFETLSGRGVATSGPLQGHVYLFSGRVTGTGASPLTNMTFSLKG